MIFLLSAGMVAAAAEPQIVFIISQQDNIVRVSIVDVSSNKIESNEFSGVLTDKIQLSESEIIILIQNNNLTDIRKISSNPSSIQANNLEGVYLDSIISGNSLLVATQKDNEVLIKRIDINDFSASGTSMDGIFLRWVEYTGNENFVLLILEGQVGETLIRKVEFESLAITSNSIEGDFKDLIEVGQNSVLVITQDEENTNIRKFDLDNLHAIGDSVQGIYDRTLIPPDKRFAVVSVKGVNEAKFKRFDIETFSSLSNSIQGDLVDIVANNESFTAISRLGTDLFVKTIRIEDMSGGGGLITNVGSVLSIESNYQSRIMSVTDLLANSVAKGEVGRPLLVSNYVLPKTSGTYVTILQIINSAGETVYLSYLSGEVGDEEVKTSRYWVPEEAGTYTIQIFNWNQISNPIPISKPEQMIFGVE